MSNFYSICYYLPIWYQFSNHFNELHILR